MDTVRTLSEHEFVLGFCGSIGVEISRLRKKWVAEGNVLFK